MPSFYLFLYFNATYNKNDKSNDLNIMVNELSELDDIEKLINKTIPETKDFLIKGICFYPEHSSSSPRKLIYMFDNKSRTSEKQNNNYGQENKNSSSEKKRIVMIKNIRNNLIIIIHTMIKNQRD